MTTTAEKLQLLINTKSAIKSAIIAKGQAVADSDTFASYANKILSISSGEAGSVIVAGVLTGVTSPIDIILTNTTTSATSSCTTDANGNYVISVPEGTYEISLSDIDYKTTPDTITLQATTQNFTAIKNYIQFEDTEFRRICVNLWGDYIEHSVTDNGDGTVVDVATPVSMLNTTETRGSSTTDPSKTKTADDIAALGADSVEGNSATWKEPVGMTYRQAAAVTAAQFNNGALTSSNSRFRGNTLITSANELKYFTSVTFLSNYAFKTCSNLASIDLINLTNLASDCFGGTKIQYAWLKNLKTYSSNSSSGAFRFASNLIAIRFDSITSVRGISNSYGRYFIVTTSSVPTNSGGLRAAAIVYVLDELVSSYQAASNWSSMTIRAISTLETYEPDCPWLDDLKEKGFVPTV